MKKIEGRIIMARYANKTCYFCAVIKPAPDMLRVEKTHTNVIKNTVTGRDIAGSLLGSKTSQRSLQKAVFSGGGRKSTRKTEVWSCYSCAGVETPAEKEARIQKEKEKRRVEKEQKAERKSLRTIVRNIAKTQKINNETTKEKLFNLDILIDIDPQVSNKDKKVLKKKIKQIIKDFTRINENIKSVSVDNKGNIIFNSGLNDYKLLIPDSMQVNPNNLDDFVGWSIFGAIGAFPFLVFDDEVGFKLASYACGSIIIGSIFLNIFHGKVIKHTLKKTSKYYFDKLVLLEKEMRNKQENAQKQIRSKAREEVKGKKEVAKKKLRNQQPKSNKNDVLRSIVEKLIKLPNALDIATLVLFYKVANADGKLRVEENRFILNNCELGDDEINFAVEMASFESSEDIIIKLINKLTASEKDIKKGIVNNLISLASIDSEISSIEEEAVKNIAKKLNVPLAGVSRRINSKKRDLEVTVIDDQTDDDILDELFD